MLQHIAELTHFSLALRCGTHFLTGQPDLLFPFAHRRKKKTTRTWYSTTMMAEDSEFAVHFQPLPMLQSTKLHAQSMLPLLNYTPR